LEREIHSDLQEMDSEQRSETADQFAQAQKAIESDPLAMEALGEDVETNYVYTLVLPTSKQFEPRPLRQQPAASAPKRARGNAADLPSLRLTLTKYTIELPKMDD
jgi:hypothetical protein